MNSKVLICDLDNTLYDWVSYFVPSFYAMVNAASIILDCTEDALLSELKLVHKYYNDTEHPFSLLETNLVKKKFENNSKKEILERLNPAFHAFNSTRKKTLIIYPGVINTLKTLKENNITLIGHTESRVYGVVDRMRRLELEPFFTSIYCREKHGDLLHAEDRGGFFENFSMQKVTELSHSQRKPDTTILLEICNDLKIHPEEAAYIGDSISKDILMAKNAGLKSIWAKYGTVHPVGYYEKLVRISHWSDADIAYERSLKEIAKSIQPDFIAENEFEEVLKFM